MKEITLDFTVSDNFELGDCGECQLSILGDGGEFYCPMYVDPTDCPLEVKKKSWDDGFQAGKKEAIQPIIEILNNNRIEYFFSKMELYQKVYTDICNYIYREGKDEDRRR